MYWYIRYEDNPLGWLADLDLLRAIPQVLERLWEKRTGKNPVSRLIRQRLAASEHRSRRKGGVIVALLAVVCFVAAILAGFVFAWTKPVGLIVLFVCVLSFVVGFVSAVILSVELDRDRRKLSDAEREDSQQFAGDLYSLSEWSGQSPSKLCLDEPALRSIATTILARQAAQVLRYQRAAKNPVAEGDAIDNKSKEKEAFEEYLVREAVLSRLGIATNNRQLYFARGAQLLLAEDEAAAPTPAEPTATAETVEPVMADTVDEPVPA
ncbi:MAG TPA: hypothetical protein VN495_02900 [Candidatus Paceibacterota bacterium]|nr:hypothetical protein [Candidatus Paceibacterota bacterium]